MEKNKIISKPIKELNIRPKLMKIPEESTEESS